MPFSRGRSQTRDETHISMSLALAGGFFTTSTTWEAYLYTYLKFGKIRQQSSFMAESEEELKRLLMKVKEESEKVGLKLNIMASGPIIPWQIDGETVETVIDFILEAPKSPQMVTAAMKLKDVCSLEEKL